MIKKKRKAAVELESNRTLSGKRILIVVVTLVALIGLSLLLLFQDQFVGKAFYVAQAGRAGLQPEGQAPITTGIDLLRLGSSKTYELKANMGPNAQSLAVSFDLEYDLGKVTSSSCNDILSILDQAFGYNTANDLHLQRVCRQEDDTTQNIHRIVVEYAGLCDATCSQLRSNAAGEVIIARIQFTGVVLGTTAVKFNNLRVYNLNDPQSGTFSLNAGGSSTIRVVQCLISADCSSSGQTCSNNVCQSGEIVTCAPNVYTCQNNELLLCNPQGNGYASRTACGTNVCYVRQPDQGTCTSCVPNTYRCTATGRQVCVANVNNWQQTSWADASCSSGQTCEGQGICTVPPCTAAAWSCGDWSVCTSPPNVNLYTQVRECRLVDTSCSNPNDVRPVISQSCTPSCVPRAEECNNLDDDCDGVVDEGLGGSITCGVGACQNSGSRLCVNGQWVESCTPNSVRVEVPAANNCNDRIDNDCDGTADAADSGCATAPLSRCGDGTKVASEQCDNGIQNGVVCTAAYSQSCTYCSATCTSTTVRGPYCGDRTANGPEQCDGSSGCTATCTVETTGGCTTHAECSGNTPICFSGRCISCTGQHQCLRDLSNTPNCITTSSDSSRQGMCVANGQVRIGETCANPSACQSGLSCVGGVCSTEVLSCSSSTLSACDTREKCEAVNRLVWSSSSCKVCPNLNGVLSRIVAWKNRNSTLQEVLNIIVLWKNQRCA